MELVSEEELKHFHTSLLGSPEDAKGLLQIKQKVLKELILSSPEIVVPQLPEDVFVSGLIPSDFADTGKVVECRI